MGLWEVKRHVAAEASFSILSFFLYLFIVFFFFNDTATTEIYTLSLHDALPIFIGKHAQLIRQIAHGIGRLFQSRVGVQDNRSLHAPDVGQDIQTRNVPLRSGTPLIACAGIDQESST